MARYGGLNVNTGSEVWVCENCDQSVADKDEVYCETCDAEGRDVYWRSIDDSGLSDECPRCRPLGCDCSDTERPEAVEDRYKVRGCHCGAWADGRDCMCFEFMEEDE